ncbi:MAG TPA: glycerophosphodiester phosphodiesterase [Spirochaetota bacterium]|nr:glycerophosphodiester phosphodiesterase [Spirochaetota bacterium]HPC41521.1 glycerophosphodiester phosphodiesterase [Spirochaetota bacterium]HPL15592.1 glycerophosphodiester phosphodiesterase [Spirochaetota bacterium]HQF09111.1 glycerophosphodiester phosphodiesterase [Spirochaetota bacterium]HQH97664.1 glycerophosphodiester phosphodiesterase [Spirochaetota bacterium]
MGPLAERRYPGEGTPFFSGFTAAAHRGASGQFPENTIEAFRRAQEILPGCMLETDVRLTGDGAIVIIHDELLEMKTNGSGPVGKAGLGEIRSLDAGYTATFDGGLSHPFRGKGYRIPLLSEALDTFPGARFSIDIKDRDLGAAERVVSLVMEKGAAHRVIIGSFHDRTMRFVRKNFRGIMTSFSRNDILGFMATRKFRRRAPARGGAAMLMPEFIGGGQYEYMGRGATRGARIITRGLINDAHRCGVPVLAWTINRPDNMRRLIEWGIDGIVTDHIDLLKKVMAEYDLR